MLPSSPSAFNQPQPALLHHALAYAGLGLVEIIPVIGKKPAGLWKPFQTNPADQEGTSPPLRQEGHHRLGRGAGQRFWRPGGSSFDDTGTYRTWAAANPGDAHPPAHGPDGPRLPRLRAARRGAVRQVRRRRAEGRHRTLRRPAAVHPPRGHCLLLADPPARGCGSPAVASAVACEAHG